MINYYNIFISCVLWVVEFAIHYPAAAVVAIIYLFPIYFMIGKVIEIAFTAFIKKMNKVLDKCSRDKEYQNDIASLIFFFADMGPSISSFSAIAIFITTSENIIVLAIIFYFGILVKQKSRKIKKWFYSEMDKRS